MTVFYKKIGTVLSVLLLTVLLTGCGCEHEWIRATCQAPRTCSRCGETEGKIRSHEWASTDCKDPQGCIHCGTLEGIELTHTWQSDCKICIHCGHDERPADDRFPEALAAGLEQRWQLEGALKEDKEYVWTAEDWADCFNAEYSLLQSFREEKFQDEALGEAALSYIGSIEASLTALEHFGTEAWEDAYHNDAYQDQTVALLEINDLRPITVSEDYAENLERMLHNGEIIKLVRPLFDQVLFLHINTMGDSQVYETTLRNTSSLKFLWFSFDVQLKDEEGNVLTTETIKVENWKPDEKKRFKFTTQETFAAVDVAFADWELSRW